MAAWRRVSSYCFLCVSLSLTLLSLALALPPLCVLAAECQQRIAPIFGRCFKLAGTPSSYCALWRGRRFSFFVDHTSCGCVVHSSTHAYFLFFTFLSLSLLFSTSNDPTLPLPACQHCNSDSNIPPALSEKLILVGSMNVSLYRIQNGQTIQLERHFSLRFSPLVHY